MQRWEYRFEHVDKTGRFVVLRDPNGRPIEWDDVNSLGLDGWELVTSLGDSQVVVFKRPLEES
jgi:hypothetical protein